MGRRAKPSWEKKVQMTFTLQPFVAKAIEKVVPKQNRSEYINDIIKQKLSSPLAYAKEQKRQSVQRMNYWDYEIKRLKDEKMFKKAGLE